MALIVGDFNAHQGKEDDSKFAFHKKNNNNGIMLQDFACENEFLVTNTCFQKKQGKLWTYKSDQNGSKTQVDFILVNKKWRNSCKNIEAYRSFDRIGSDHRLLICDIKVSFKGERSNKHTKVDNIRWECLRDSKIAIKMTKEVKEKLECDVGLKTSDPTSRYDNFLEAIEASAIKILPTMIRKKRISLAENEKVVKARAQIKKESNKYILKPDQENKNSLK